MTTQREQILAFSFQLQSAMGSHPSGSAEKLTLAAAVGDIDTLLANVPSNLFGLDCLEARPDEGSWVHAYWYEHNCIAFETGFKTVLAAIGDDLNSFEPGLAETAYSMADQAQTSMEQTQDITPDVGDLWENTPDFLKWGALVAGLLLAREVLK